MFSGSWWAPICWEAGWVMSDVFVLIAEISKAQSSWISHVQCTLGGISIGSTGYYLLWKLITSPCAMHVPLTGPTGLLQKRMHTCTEATKLLSHKSFSLRRYLHCDNHCSWRCDKRETQLSLAWSVDAVLPLKFKLSFAKRFTSLGIWDWMLYKGYLCEFSLSDCDACWVKNPSNIFKLFLECA